MSEQATHKAGTRPVYKVNEPISHNNLSVFLIDGEEVGRFADLLTLEEAIDRELLVVHETANVNQLAADNLSPEFDVFIQTGDIVKGGMQDRLLASSIIIPKGSGVTPLESFCVESGRWHRRGAEPEHRFSSSRERVASKELKIAALRSRSQHEVWLEVSEMQSKLEAAVQAPVIAKASPSSLLGSLENENVRATVEDYVNALADTLGEYPNAVGLAYAVNGRVVGCDIFGSRSLFRKLWMKQIRAAAVEATADGLRGENDERATTAAVRAFLRRAERGVRNERPAIGSCRIVTVDSPRAFVTETSDAESGSVIHRSYVSR